MIRELVEGGFVTFAKVDTTLNASDALTKPLAKQLHLRHTTTMMGAQ
jgi:hypothetical protein